MLTANKDSCSERKRHRWEGKLLLPSPTQIFLFLNLDSLGRDTVHQFRVVEADRNRQGSFLKEKTNWKVRKVSCVKQDYVALGYYLLLFPCSFPASSPPLVWKEMGPISILMWNTHTHGHLSDGSGDPESLQRIQPENHLLHLETRLQSTLPGSEFHFG